MVCVLQYKRFKLVLSILLIYVSLCLFEQTGGSLWVWSSVRVGGLHQTVQTVCKAVE